VKSELSQPIQVVGEHPKYSFKKGEIRVVVADDKDLFWIAEMINTDNEKIAFHYYHYTINQNDEKIYKLHNFTRSYGPADIISHFSTKDRIFTKNRRIRKASLKKIQKEYYMYIRKKMQYILMIDFFGFDFVGILILLCILIVCPTLFNTLESCPSICTMVNTYTFFNKCVMTLLLGTNYEHSLEVSICDVKVRELFKNK
jgi:hypothetical protein